MKRTVGVALLMISAALARAADDPPTRTADDARSAIRRGAAFLLKDQNPDGSWGGARNAVYTFTGDVWSNPETHRAWRVATTALCVMALLETDESPAGVQAVDRGLNYVIENIDVKQPNEWDTMNNWAYIYGLQALAVADGHPRFADSTRRVRFRSAARRAIENLEHFQSLSGGWGYLELWPPRTARPQWATSFTTAAGVVALQRARQEGIEVDAAMLARAVRGVRRCRLPNGAFTYSVQAIAHPRRIGSIDRISGSLGRIQVCNLALLMSGDELSTERLKTGLDHFFRRHRFLDIARNRPIPHEAFYQNSGYFYFFGHYYAALLIERLPPDLQDRYWPRLRYEIIKTQQSDGAMWDYDMHAYHKPYGVSFGLLTLARSIAE